jgi:hypothetical protein
VSVKIGARFAPNIPQAQKSFWMHSMELLSDWGHMESHSVRLEIVLVSMQVRCTVCAERTTGLEIILDAHKITPR